MNELLVMLPDALLFGALCILVLVAAFSSSRRFLTGSAIVSVLIYLWGIHYQSEHVDYLKSLASPHLQSLFAFDSSAFGMKQFAAGVTLISLLFLEGIFFKRTSSEGKEGIVILLFALLGASLMVGASHYLMSYLGLELLSLALVVLIAWGLETPQVEAGVKFFILSSLASGILLFGISLIYGSTGQLKFVSSALVRYPFHQLYIVGQVFLIAGIAFKLGWVPFHFWLSDIYASGRWYTVVALGSISKIGTLGFLLRLYDAKVFVSIGTPLAIQLMIVLSVLSIFIGNILAIQQNSLRRLLAYSSIANMGFLGLAVVCKTGAPFYLMVYILNSLPVAAILFNAFGHSLDVKLEDIKGFGIKYPYQSAVLSLAMLSLAGIPMTPGFWAKWHVFKAFFASYSPWFAVFIIAGNLVGMFYYFRVIKYLYEDVTVESTSSIPAVNHHGVISHSNGNSYFSYSVLMLALFLSLVWLTISPNRWLIWSEQITGASPVVLDETRKTDNSPANHLRVAPPVPVIIPSTVIPKHPKVNTISNSLPKS